VLAGALAPEPAATALAMAPVMLPGLPVLVVLVGVVLLLLAVEEDEVSAAEGAVPPLGAIAISSPPQAAPSHMIKTPMRHLRATIAMASLLHFLK
jgi:hypothetical protein